MNNPDRSVRTRDEAFAQKIPTKIWFEQADKNNPFVSTENLCYGYSLNELVKKKSYIEVLFLLFNGELPSPEQGDLLEKLFVGLINPGPRHPAVRAAQCAGIGKTDTAHILPIGLSVLSGEYCDANSIESVMRFLRTNQKRQLTDILNENDHQGVYPGFGKLYGARDISAQKLVDILLASPGAGDALKFGHSLASALNQRGCGWLVNGVAAAVFCDLGFMPRVGAGLFQLIRAPGVLAHGLEMANKPLTAMPFLSDEQYFIEEV